MKKALLLTLEFPPHIGGISSYYKNLCDHLPPGKICVFTSSLAGSEDRDFGYTVYRKKLLWENPLIWPKWTRVFSSLHKIIQNEKIEVILAGQILPLGTAAYLYKFRANIPYFLFCHGMDIAGLSGRKKITARRVIQESKGIITNSIFTRHLIEKFSYPREHIYTLYPCPEILPESSDMDILRLKNLYDLHNKKILLTVGRIVPRKGHGLVIEVLPELIKKYPNIKYIIVGEGPYKTYLQEIAKRLHIQSHVVFTGKASKETLSAMYEMCDIFVMPCHEGRRGDIEGFGTVFLEANLFGKPVIAGTGGGAEEAVMHEKTGLVIDSKNKTELLGAIDRLLTDHALCAKLGIQGMDRVYRDFQWHNEAEKLIKILS